MLKPELELNKETLLALEQLNLSYNEMIDFLGLKITPYYLSKLFKKFEIHHKSKKERIYKAVVNTEGSVRFLARKFECSPATIQKIKKEIKNGNCVN